MGESTMAINRPALSTIASNPPSPPLFDGIFGLEIFQIFQHARQRFEIAR